MVEWANEYDGELECVKERTVKGFWFPVRTTKSGSRARKCRSRCAREHSVCARPVCSSNSSHASQRTMATPDAKISKAITATNYHLDLHQAPIAFTVADVGVAHAPEFAIVL